MHEITIQGAPIGEQKLDGSYIDIFAETEFEMPVMEQEAVKAPIIIPQVTKTETVKTNDIAQEEKPQPVKKQPVTPEIQKAEPVKRESVVSEVQKKEVPQKNLPCRKLQVWNCQKTIPRLLHTNLPLM